MSRKVEFFMKRVMTGFCLRAVIVFLGVFASLNVFAGTTQLTLSAINTSFTSGVKNIVVLMQDIATVAGIGFVFSSFFKFHQHKMNPQQVPLSQGVTMLMIGAGLTVFPHLLNTASKAVFGQSIAKVGSASISGVISS